MPFYEYQCQNCGHELEVLQKMSDDPLVTCPACQHDTLKKKISAAGFRLKGSGWYETDFKSGNNKQLASGDSTKNNDSVTQDSSGQSNSTAAGSKNSGPNETSSGSGTSTSESGSSQSSTATQSGSTKQAGNTQSSPKND